MSTVTKLMTLEEALNDDRDWHKLGYEVETREVGKVYSSFDYQQFHFIEENRDAKVRKDLLKSIKEKGLIQPIIVNEEYEIIDGQHRFLACKKLGEPIIFTIKYWNNDRGSESIDTLINVNTTSQNWRFQDYVDAYAKTGNEEYMRLKELIEDTKGYFTPNTVGMICGGINEDSFKNNANNRVIKAGEFKFYNYYAIVNFFNDFKDMIDNINKYSGRKQKTNEQFILAYFNLYANKSIDKNRLNKVIFREDIIAMSEGINNSSRIIEMIINMYNKKLYKENRIQLNRGFFSGREIIHVPGEKDYRLVREVD